MRSLLMVGVLLFAVAGSAVAQDYPKGEVAGNYIYIRINPGGGASHIDCQGGGGSGAYSLNNYLGVVGEFSGCKWTGLPSGLSAHTITYLFGPRVTYRGYGRLEPFGEALLGGAHDSASGGGATVTDNAFAMALGGGVDYKWKPNLTIRFVQADYFYTKFGSTHQNNFRLQAGIVYRFGGR
jgi:opacity protein-like surface antigen